MITTTGKLTIIDLGKDSAQYFWNGVALGHIVGVFVYRKTFDTGTGIKVWAKIVEDI